MESPSITRGTRLSHCAHRGPLYVQKPFYPEGANWAHVYILHPPGGIVSGDCLDISVRAGEGAGVLLTTPGAARVYRARDTLPRQRQHTQLRVEAGACLEWFPLETIVYDGADVEITTDIELAANARCAAWEISCFGLPASGEPFLRGVFNQRYRVLRGGRPVFVDQLSLTDDNRRLMTASAGLQGHPVSGFFLIGPCCGPVDNALTASLHDCVENAGQQRRAAISRVGEFYLGRYLGGSAEQARQLFTAWWRVWRPLLRGRPACPPRIWLT